MINAIFLSIIIKSILPSLAEKRIQAISYDIIAVVNEELTSINNIHNLTTGVSLLSGVIIGESGLREDVESCKVMGDRGRSIGLGQVMSGPNWLGYTRKEICSDRKLQLKISLHVLDVCAKFVKPNTDTIAIFRCYTTGDFRKDVYIARYENKLSKEVTNAIILNDYLEQVRTRSWVLGNYKQYPYRSLQSLFKQL